MAITTSSVRSARSVRWLSAALCTGALALPLALTPVHHSAPHAGNEPGFSVASWGDVVADTLALGTNGKNDPTADPGSLCTVEDSIGARKVWTQKDSKGRQITGQGVTVALVTPACLVAPTS